MVNSMFGSVMTERDSGPPGERAHRAAKLAGFGAFVLVAVFGLWAAGARDSRAAISSTLYAGFDADGNIYLTFTDGTKIGAPTLPGTLVPAGTYTINLNNNGIDDLGNPHQFHLTGPGVNLVAAQVESTTTSTATFQPGATYVFDDDINPTTIREVFGTPGSGAGSSTVSTGTTVSSPPPAKTTPKPTNNNPLLGTGNVPFRGRLTGSVSSAGKLALLTSKGKSVSSLKAGRYTLAVTDKSARNGFTLQEIHKAAKTISSTSFVGKHSATVVLKAGQWFFYSNFVGKKTYFIVVS
jgi:hypothetical protein